MRKIIYTPNAGRLLLGFVDDLEFFWDRKEKVCHVRSASRIGYSDLGKNRRRVEFIRRQFEKDSR